MRIPLNLESPVPLYQQIQGFLRTQIESGSLPSEMRLPATRTLAASLGVSRITVTNAYADLEAEGLIYMRPGSGTFVSPTQGATYPMLKSRDRASDWPLWQQELLSRTWLPTYRELESLLTQVTHPEPISFTAGLGALEIFPVEEFRKTMNTTLRREGYRAFEYGDRAGNPTLRATIAHILTNQGIPTTHNEVLITSGSQQAMALVAGLILRPGDIVVVESPTYVGAIDLFRSLDVRLLGVPMDKHGMIIDSLDEILQTSRPRLIYTIPTFHNPTGSCMSATRRRRLVDLASRYDVPILEDDCFGDLRFEGRALPALKALDTDGNVIYTNTFSKVLMPGLRIGFLVASGPIYEGLIACKHASDLVTCNPIQRALDAYLSVGRYQAHARRTCRLYRQRRDAMVKALERHLATDVRWHTPRGGLFIWLHLPEGCSANDLFTFAGKEGVTYAPGSLFFPGEREQPFLRLNFTINQPEIIEEGIRRLGRALDRYLASDDKPPNQRPRPVAI
ncbi:MAG: aminotransferase class I/II-fold pyridoxal phosphate-dependent enzyme [Anaerolineales bacterium]|nr:aminotransferase class I/II-fold pyridoxal phosphate-dependent enzyme [Anaerolineales bacterium]